MEPSRPLLGAVTQILYSQELTPSLESTYIRLHIAKLTVIKASSFTWFAHDILEFETLIAFGQRYLRQHSKKMPWEETKNYMKEGALIGDALHSTFDILRQASLLALYRSYAEILAYV
jgi:hypothetical protein